jgi:hypothetical protein
MTVPMPGRKRHLEVVGSQRRNRGSAGRASASQRIEYLADLILELRQLAENAGLHRLTDLLEEARKEARNQAVIAGDKKVIHRHAD